jgi:hypothetical protein
VGVVATLLKQEPAAAKFTPKLDALAGEHAHLRAENARLQKALAEYITQWETLDGPQVSVMQYLAAHERGHAAQIAKAINVNIQIAETGLAFMQQCACVCVADAAGAAGGTQKGASKRKPGQYCLTAKGTRYLRERGLIK